MDKGSAQKSEVTLKELGLVGASESKLSGSMSPEFPTVAAYIHRFSVPSAPSASGPPNSSGVNISSESFSCKRKNIGEESGGHINTSEWAFSPFEKTRKIIYEGAL